MTDARRVTVVWLALLVLTFLSVVLGFEGKIGTASTILIIGVALFKVRLIGVHFMDLRVAPAGLRIAFDSYVLVTFVALATIGLVVH